MSRNSDSDRCVSVLIPVHGDAEFVLEAVKSVLLQSNVNFEILLILDRVTFACHEKLKSLEKASLVRIIESFKPGISNALNLGLRNAHYDIIARLDSDDLMAPERLSKQFQCMVSSSDVAVVGSSIQLIDARGILLNVKKFPIKSPQIENLLRYRNCLAHPAVMIRKSVLEALNGYRPEFEPAEDYDLWLRISGQQQFSFICLPETLTLYRIHDSQVSARSRVKQIKISRIMAKMFRLGPESYSNLNLDVDLRSTTKNELDIFFMRCFEESTSNFFKKISGLFFFCLLNPIETYHFLRGQQR
jgi:glycosyltransferase involved in cell wall biosynthesis